MTPRALEVLDFIRGQLEMAGVAPTYSEIGIRFGLASKSSVHRLIDELVRYGHLIRHHNRARGLTLADVPDLRSVPADALKAELARRGADVGALAWPARRAIGRGARSCSVDGCFTEVRPGHPFCLPHWRRISPETQNELFAANEMATSRRTDEQALRRYQDAFTAAKLEAERPLMARAG